MKKALIVFTVLFFLINRVNAQYTSIICGPTITPAVNYIFVGSINMDENNGSNSQKLKVDVFGGGFLGSTSGETTFYIANRGGLSVNQVTMGSATNNGIPFNLAAFQVGSTTNFYLALNSANSYYSLAVKAYLFGYTLNGSAVTISTQSATPSGTDITANLNVKPVLITDNNGNIGLGTFSPDANYRLSVSGKIRAKEIKVETGWADFVFDPDYQLRSLREVEQFIADHHHLPDVPSATEVKKNGLSLGESNTVLLRKVEELTLYLIEKDKELRQQQARIEALEKAIKQNR